MRVLAVSPTVPWTQEYALATSKSFFRYTPNKNCHLFWAANKCVDELSTAALLGTVADGVDRVIIDTTKEDRGCGGGWNAGLEYALANDYDEVLFFTNDTLFSEDWLVNLLSYKKEHPDVGCVSPIWHWIGFPDDIDILDFDKLLDWNDSYSSQAQQFAKEHWDDALIGLQGCFFMIPCDVFRELEKSEKDVEPMPGRFDTESYPIAYWEDADILMRLWRAGYKARVPHRSCLHHFGAKTLSDEVYHKQAGTLYLQNQMNFYKKWNILDKVGVQFMCHNSVVAFNSESEVLLPSGVHSVDCSLGDFLVNRGL